MTKREQLIEKLAELEHLQWLTWTRVLLEEEKGLSKERVKRWTEFRAAYDDLSEKNKEGDRYWANKVMEIFDEYYQ